MSGNDRICSTNCDSQSFKHQSQRKLQIFLMMTMMTVLSGGKLPVSKMPSLSPRNKVLQMSDWHSFKPMYFMVTYKDSATKTEHVVVIIALSGMCHGNLLKCHLQVEEGWQETHLFVAVASLFHGHGSVTSQAGEQAWQVCPRH